MSTKTDHKGKLGPGPWCGTAGGYSNHKCKCDACREAWRLHCSRYMESSPDQREKHRRRTRAKRAAQRARNR